MRKFGLFLVLLFSSPLTWAADECSVGDLSYMPWSMKLDSSVEACRQRAGRKECASINNLNYGAIAIGLSKMAGGCGAKSSEIKLEDGKLTGVMNMCNGDRAVQTFNLKDASCQVRKSIDGKYDLQVCYQQDGNELFTLAFRSNDTSRKSGYLLMQSVGNDEVLSVNKMSCGADRVKVKIEPPRGQRDVQIEPVEATS